MLLLHGGGQTRHAWSKTGELIARMGRVAYAVDQRGHGDSDWVDDGAYSTPISPPTPARWRTRWRSAAAGGRPWSARRSAAWRRCSPARSRASRALLGAGAGRHHAAGRSRGRLQDPGLHAGQAPRGLRLDRGGGRRRRGLSAASAAAALPRGPEEEPAAASGRPLALALGPALHRGQPPHRRGLRRDRAALVEAAKRVTIPTLLVRGASSELVQEEHAREFLKLVPHAKYVDVGGARHMVAGDRNDQFANAIERFLWTRPNPVQSDGLTSCQICQRCGITDCISMYLLQYCG